MGNHSYIEPLNEGILWIFWLLQRLFVEERIGVDLCVRFSMYKDG